MTELAFGFLPHSFTANNSLASLKLEDNQEAGGRLLSLLESILEIHETVFELC